MKFASFPQRLGDNQATIDTVADWSWGRSSPDTFGSSRIEFGGRPANSMGRRKIPKTLTISYLPTEPRMRPALLRLRNAGRWGRRMNHLPRRRIFWVRAKFICASN